MKRTFVVPDEKEAVYEKFKASVPEVSGKLVELMEEYVNKLEALDGQFIEQTIHKGTEHENGIFNGESFKFFGVLIAKGENLKTDDTSIYKYIYLTRKGRLLVWTIVRHSQIDMNEYDYSVFEDYFDMRAKAGLSKDLTTQCEAYLNKNSVVRTYKVLDV